MEWNHYDRNGRIRMVDISAKDVVFRKATAEGCVELSPETGEKIKDLRLPKGDPFEIARIAGIQAAKRTSEWVPLCHQLNLDWVDVDIKLEENVFLIRSTVCCRWATGVEMEALTAVTAAALTLYDMCKAVDKKIVIGRIRLVSKEKGKYSPGQSP